jgi:replicative DNA helicase
VLADLVSARCWGSALAAVEARIFLCSAHRIIYETLLEWKGVDQVEFPWLKEEIKKRGHLEEVGGAAFLNEPDHRLADAAKVR